jgi:hypothetical protein
MTAQKITWNCGVCREHHKDTKARRCNACKAYRGSWTCGGLPDGTHTTVTITENLEGCVVQHCMATRMVFEERNGLWYVNSPEVDRATTRDPTAPLEARNWICHRCGRQMEERDDGPPLCGSCGSIEKTWMCDPCHVVDDNGNIVVGVTPNGPHLKECKQCGKSALPEDEDIPIAVDDSSPSPGVSDEVQQGQYREGGESGSSLREQVGAGKGKGRAS